MSPADLGRYAQARFVLDAVEHGRGLRVFVPSADYPAIDLVAIRGKQCFRIQVKGARREQHETKSRYSLCMTSRDSRPRYQPGDYDILAAWLHEEKSWVFIPEPTLGRLTHLTITAGKGRAAALNNWDIFDSEA